MERVKWMLIPFRFATWLKLGFIGWLAGEMAGGANLNFPTSFPGRETLPPGGAPSPHFPTGALVAIIAVVLVFVFLLGLVFLYLASRFRFILFDSVIHGQADIGRGWRSYRDPANRYFGFSLVYAFLSLLIAGLLIGLPVWSAYKRGVFSSGNVWSIVMLVVWILVTLLVFALISYVIGTAFRDFVAPLMALDNLRLREAWSSVWQLMRSEPGAFAAYMGMKILLGIAAGIGMAIATVVLLLILLVPAVVVVLMLAGLAGVLHSKIAIAGIITVGVVLFLLFVAVMFVITLTLQAPIVVFFESYRQYFFAGRYPKLEALLWPAPPTPPAPAAENLTTDPARRD